MGPVEDRSDGELLRASGSDAAAFGVFYDRHARAVSAYFVRRCADHALAADLTAETFAAAFASRKRYRETDARATGWLFTIAARQLNEYFRRQRVARTYRDRLGIDASTAVDDFERVDDLDELQHRLPELARAMEGLSAGLAEAVTLRIGHGWSYHELARHLGCTPAAARVRVSRALHHLEDQLDPTDRGRP